MANMVKVPVLTHANVTVEYEYEYEDGECGTHGYYVTDWAIIEVDGKARSANSFVVKQIARLYDEEITEACNADLNGF